MKLFLTFEFGLTSVMRRYFALIYLVLQVYSLNALNVDSLYASLKLKYQHLSVYEGSTIFMNVKIKVRYTDTTPLNYLIRIVSTSKKHPEVYVAAQGVQSYLIDHKITARNNKNDSWTLSKNVHVNLNKKIPRKRNSIINHNYYSLVMLPIADQGFFDNKTYSAPSLYKLSHDTTVLLQYLKSENDSDIYRLIYIDGRSDIFKVEEISTNPEEPTEFWSIELIKAENNTGTFDQMARYYGLGKFTDSKIQLHRAQPMHDSLYQKNFIFFLSGDSLNLDTCQYEYFLLDYYYIGCWPCWLSIPGLKSIDSIIDKSKIMIIGVNPRDKKSDILSFKQGKSITYPQLDYDKKGGIFEIYSFPTFILIDRHLKVIKIWVGYKKDFQIEIIDFLRQYNLLK